LVVRGFTFFQEEKMSKRRAAVRAAGFKRDIKATMLKLGIKDIDPKQMMGLMCRWIMERNAGTIDQVVKEAEARGEPFMVVIDESGIDKEGNIAVRISSGPTAKLEGVLGKTPEYLQMKSAMAINPGMIGILIVSETFDKTCFALRPRRVG
jgi:hypothetical protein